MRIEVSKSELAGALAALGKLVSRTSPVEAFRSVEIEGKENQIVLRTANTDESIAFRMAVEVPEPFRVLVNFDDFRTVVRCSRNKVLGITLENGQFAVDGLAMRIVTDPLPPLPQPGNDCTEVELPSGFVNLLATAAPIVNRNEYRKVMQGIHLCPDGIVVSNGKELLHLNVPMKIAPMTLPFSLALLATKSDADGTISTWTDQDARFFRMELGNWLWSGKLLSGIFPPWKQVIPDRTKLNHIVKFTPESAAQLTEFLKTVPDNPPNNPVTLSQENGELKVVAENGQQIAISAEFPTAWEAFRISVNKTLLLRLLSEGHTQLACGEERSPFLATGGLGTYVAMPLMVHPQNNVHPQTQEEEKEMNENTNAVAAPMQPVAPNSNPNPEPTVPVVNPLDDLATAVDEFKGRIRAMFDESASLARKVKEVAIAQKQKERDFILAKRAIERIRMAI